MKQLELNFADLVAWDDQAKNLQVDYEVYMYMYDLNPIQNNCIMIVCFNGQH